MSMSTPKTSSPKRRPRARTLLVAGLLAASTLLLLAGCGDDGEETTTSAEATETTSQGVPPTDGPIEVSPEELSEFAQLQTIYWAGEIPGTKLELTVNEVGNLFLRYIDEDAEIGTSDPYLTISTYPADPALELLQTEAQRTGAETEELPGGGLVMIDADSPTNVYLAYPGGDFQVEVYDPDPEKARSIVTDGELEPVV